MFDVGCSMLDVRCWMLDVGCWMLDVRCWMLDVGCWMLDVRCCMFDVGCWMFDVRCWMLDVGCWMFDVGCSMGGGSFRSPIRHTAFSISLRHSAIQWTPHPQPWLLHHMSVNLRCFHVLMPEKFLNRADVIIRVQQMRRKAMSHHVRRH